MTCRVVGDAVGIIRAYVFQAEAMNEELGQLIDARRQGRYLCRELMVAELFCCAWVDIAHHADTGGRGSHNDLGLAEDVHKAPDECHGLSLVTGVVVHLPAARLLLREIDRVSEALE